MLRHSRPTHDTKIAPFQRDNSNLESALGAQKDAVGKANQKVSSLEAALETARVGAEILKADYDTKVTCFQRDNSNLESALSAQKEAFEKANQKILSLESALQVAREDAQTAKADYDSKVARFQLDNSMLESALGAQKEAVEKANKIVSSLEVALETAQAGVETFEADYDTKNRLFSARQFQLAVCTQCSERGGRKCKSESVES